MTTVTETNSFEIKQLYELSLGLVLNLPSLSIGIKSIMDKNLTKSQKITLIGMTIISVSCIMLSKKYIPISIAINIITVLYYKHITSKTKDSHEYINIWTNTLLLLSFLISTLYTCQMCLRKQK